MSKWTADCGLTYVIVFQVLSYGRDKRVIIEAADADRSCALACALAAAYLGTPQRSHQFSPQSALFLSAAKANWVLLLHKNSFFRYFVPTSTFFDK